MDGPCPSSASSCYAYSRPKGSSMDQSIPERVAATLSELGLPAPTNIIQTMLMHDGYFVGWKVPLRRRLCHFAHRRQHD